MFNKYSRKLLVALLIVVAFFAVSVVAVSAQINKDGQTGGPDVLTNSNPNGDGSNSFNGGTKGDDNGGDKDGGHDKDHSCDWGHYDSRYCPPREGDCDDKDRDHDGKCPVTPQCPTTCGYQGGTILDGHGKTTTCNATPACVTPTTAPSNPGGSGGSGVSDGRSDGLSSCPSCTQAPQGQVLGASVGPQVLGLSYTSGEESVLPQLLQIFGALTSAGFGLIFLKKNA